MQRFREFSICVGIRVSRSFRTQIASVRATLNHIDCEDACRWCNFFRGIRVEWLGVFWPWLRSVIENLMDFIAISNQRSILATIVFSSICNTTGTAFIRQRNRFSISFALSRTRQLHFVRPAMCRRISLIKQ